MNLNQLKIFYFAAKRGNLSAAAQKLFIPQPAATKGIQRLQEFYEMKFVDHIGKKLVPTDTGAVLMVFEWAADYANSHIQFSSIK